MLRSLAPHAGLLALLTIATFFEGFDTKLASLVQPVIGREFGASTEALGRALGFSSFGMVLAFFVIERADRIGRRPVFLMALAAYSLLTLATGFAWNLVVFTGLQMFARMAMAVELGLAYIILSESLPPAIRGRANGFLGAFAAFGATIPPALLAPLEAVGLGWRGLFAIGALPLVLLPLYWRRLRETPAYDLRAAARSADDVSPERSRLALLLGPGLRGRLAAISLVWLGINFWAGSALYFFTIYVFDERGWTSTDLLWLPLGTIPFGIAGYALSGFAMDYFGRRGATGLYLVAAFLGTTLCYQSTHPGAIYLGWFCLIGLGGVWTIATTWTAELFPTALRATALGIANNLLGRMGLVLGPIAAGSLSTHWGSTADAITALGAVTLLCLPIVCWLLPETRGADLVRAATVEPRVETA